MKAYLLVLEIEPLKVDQTYAMLPLHCTLVHWFWLDGSKTNRIIDILEITTKSLSPLEIISGKKETFTGMTKNGPIPVTVHTVEPVAKLRQLHSRICDKLDELNVQYSMPQYIREGYTPHVTNQSTGEFTEGSTMSSFALYLVEADQPEYGNDRRIVERFKFNHNEAR